MTSPIDPGYLGYQPTIEPMKLTTGASFVQTIQAANGGTFPSGTSANIVVTSPSGTVLGTWAATNVTTTSLGWVVSNSVTDLIPANSRYTMLVTFPTTPTPTVYAWYEGAVQRT